MSVSSPNSGSSSTVFSGWALSSVESMCRYSSIDVVKLISPRGPVSICGDASASATTLHSRSSAPAPRKLRIKRGVRTALNLSKQLVKERRVLMVICVRNGKLARVDVPFDLCLDTSQQLMIIETDAVRLTMKKTSPRMFRSVMITKYPTPSRVRMTRILEPVELAGSFVCLQY